MKDKTLLLAILVSCGIHTAALAMKMDLSRAGLPDNPPTIEVQLIGPPQAKPQPVQTAAGSPMPICPPKKGPKPEVKAQPHRPAKSKPEPKPLQAVQSEPASVPETNQSFEPQPATEPTDETIILKQSPSSAVTTPTFPNGSTGDTDKAPGQNIGDSGEKGGVPGGVTRGDGSRGRGRYGVGTIGSMPAYAFNPKPEYPPTARRDGQEGKTILLVEVLPDGHAGRMKVEKSSGYKILDEAAIEAVRKWKFVPAKRGRKCITAWARIPVDFSLND